MVDPISAIAAIGSSVAGAVGSAASSVGGLSTLGSVGTTALGLAGTAASVAGGLTSAQGALAQGQATLSQNLYQAGIAQLDASIAKQNADLAINAGEQATQKYALAGGQTLANIETAQASSGIDVNSGSAVAVRAGQKQVINMDVDQIRSDAAKQAYNFDVTALQYQKQAGLYQLAGANAVQGAGINAQASILGTISGVSSKWLQGSQSGLFGSSTSSTASYAGLSTLGVPNDNISSLS